MYRFTSSHIIKAQKALRHAAGMWEETFDESQFIALLSTELRMLRDQNRSWEEISGLLRTQAHIEIEPATLAEFARPRRRKRTTHS